MPEILHVFWSMYSQPEKVSPNLCEFAKGGGNNKKNLDHTFLLSGYLILNKLELMEKKS